MTALSAAGSTRGPCRSQSTVDRLPSRLPKQMVELASAAGSIRESRNKRSASGWRPSRQASRRASTNPFGSRYPVERDADIAQSDFLQNASSCRHSPALDATRESRRTPAFRSRSNRSIGGIHRIAPCVACSTRDWSSARARFLLPDVVAASRSQTMCQNVHDGPSSICAFQPYLGSLFSIWAQRGAYRSEAFMQSFNKAFKAAENAC